jgi:hypothetical protein
VLSMRASRPSELTHNSTDVASAQSGIRSNVIILTSGETGSSVLAGLIARAGYWTGDATFKKKEYDTYENSELIRLNLELLKQSGYTGNYMMEFTQEAIDQVTSLRSEIEEMPYRNFIERCQAHRPWIWKEPRLWLTIRAWAPLLDLSGCKFILLTRDTKHAWVSTILRRHIRSYGSLKRYEQSIKDSLTSFLNSHRLSCLHVTYEDLIARPERAISEINTYLETHLSVRDLEAIYRGPLHKTPRSSPFEFVKAVMIYLKNYSVRADLAERKSHKQLSL